MKNLSEIRTHAQRTMDWAERQGADVSDLRDEFGLYPADEIDRFDAEEDAAAEADQVAESMFGRTRVAGLQRESMLNILTALVEVSSVETVLVLLAEAAEWNGAAPVVRDAILKAGQVARDDAGWDHAAAMYGRKRSGPGRVTKLRADIER